jgi:hypothetical protein
MIKFINNSYHQPGLSVLLNDLALSQIVNILLINKNLSSTVFIQT